MKHSETVSYETFLKNLRDCSKQIRLEQELTQKEFAAHSKNLTQSTIAKIEGGETTNIGLKAIFEIAHASSIPLSALIQRAEQDLNTFNDTDLWDKIDKKVRTFTPKRRERLAKMLENILEEIPNDR